MSKDSKDKTLTWKADEYVEWSKDLQSSLESFPNFENQLSCFQPHLKGLSI